METFIPGKNRWEGYTEWKLWSRFQHFVFITVQEELSNVPAMGSEGI
jgi:hypothetical protein